MEVQTPSPLLEIKYLDTPLLSNNNVLGNLSLLFSGVIENILLRIRGKLFFIHNIICNYNVIIIYKYEIKQ